MVIYITKESSVLQEGFLRNFNYFWFFLSGISLSKEITRRLLTTLADLTFTWSMSLTSLEVSL